MAGAVRVARGSRRERAGTPITLLPASDERGAMPPERGALDVDDLLKIVLVLVIVWLAISIVEEIVGLLLPGPLSSVVGLLLLVILVLWYFDYI